MILRLMSSIPIKVYEEVKGFEDFIHDWTTYNGREIVWVDNNGINTPYVVTIIGEKHEK